MSERPFWEDRLLRPDKARTTAALIVVAGLAFFCGIVVLFVVAAVAVRGGLSSPHAMEGVLYGLVIGTLAVGGVLTMILYFAAGLRSGDRGGGRDFMVISGSSLAGSLLTFAVMVAIAAPIQKEDAAIQASVAESHRIMVADAKAFDAEFQAATGADLLSFRVLARDPGLKDTRRKVARSREVVAKYRALQARRQVENRARLSKALTNEKRRKAVLARYDQDALADRPRTDRYWDLQDQVMADIDVAVSHLARSPGQWGPQGYIFNRKADFDRSGGLFRQVDATTAELKAHSLEMQYGAKGGGQPAAGLPRN